MLIRAELLALVEVLVGKEVISTEEAFRVNEVSDLIKLLVEHDLIEGGEVKELTLLYGSFLDEIMRMYKGGVHDEATFKRLKERFGAKFPKIFQLLEKKHAHTREETDPPDVA